ncbi:MAG TPA: Asp-tRNA(Asn)/Glu-tRNA(Gln) amidotransferase GatCAB subunit B [Planctomycetes bacterium]|nr:Asp-tRNA(Asn)/Glu-tRNA(Gln) amidotransferase GatCAB subunit B [Planctomycetota bacterium]
MSSKREEALERFELVVGVETHAQLNTRSKLFCGCEVDPGADPNTRTCPVCLGMPGTLPVLNREAFRKALRLAVALDAELLSASEMDRKNYYYADLPKNYQISQLYAEIGPRGGLTLLRSGRRVRMHNVHLEEDAGKLIHGDEGTSTVDFNRAGTPLAEIVTYPDFRAVEEVDDYMETLTQLLLLLDLSRCQMQEGNLRFEASISVRERGSEELSARTEIKNLNSYSAVRRAVHFEHARQMALLLAGKTPRQETRLWKEDFDPQAAGASEGFEADVPAEVRAELADLLPLLPETKDGWRGRTGFMRSKEDAHDYRYFPEPDLPALEIDPSEVAALRAGLPELPGARRRRYVEVLGLAQKSAEVFARDPELARVFEDTVAAGADAVEAANLIQNQLAALLNERGVSASESPVSAAWLAELLALVGELPKDLVLKQVWPKVAEEERSPREVVSKHGIKAVDEGALLKAVDEAWAKNPKAVADLRAGKKKAAGAIVGAVMKATRGQASPKLINARIQELLASE